MPGGQKLYALFRETEFKDFIEFRENDNYVHYQNNKTWVCIEFKNTANVAFNFRFGIHHLHAIAVVIMIR